METLRYAQAPGFRNLPDRVWCDDDYREIVITELADENAALRELNDQLVDLLADLTLENVRFRLLYDREFVVRFRGDITITQLRRQLGVPVADDTPDPSRQ